MKSNRKRRAWGKIRKLPSGKYQASFLDHRGIQRLAPKTFLTYENAEFFLDKTKIEVKQKTFQQPSKITLQEWAEEFFASKQEWAGQTRIGKEITLKQYVLADFKEVNLAKMPIAEITTREILKWWTAVQEKATINTKKLFLSPKSEARSARKWAFANQIPVPITGRLAPEIVQKWREAGSPIETHLNKSARAGATASAKAYQVLRQLFISALEADLIAKNPCKIKGAGIVKHPERKPITQEQIIQLANKVPKRYYSAVMVAGALTGRGGEQFALKRKDYDPIKKSLFIDKSLEEVNGKVNIKGTKTGATGEVFLPSAIASILEKHLEEMTDKSPEALIWTTPEGNYIKRATRYSWFNPARDSLGLSWFRWHDFRHTAGTHLKDVGADFKDIKTSQRQTSDRVAMIYTHTNPERLQALAEEVNKKVVVSLEEFKNRSA
jgi:integrase